jgi:hypothetical protein
MILIWGDHVEARETLETMKLEELARAAMAKAIYKKRMGEKIANSHSLEDENLALDKLTNDDRGHTTNNWG